MDVLRRFQTQFTDYWLKLGPARRYALIGAAVGVLLLLAAVSYLSPGSSYSTVYSDLTPEDAGAVRTRLKEKGIEAKFDAGGTAVQVPADRLADARVALAEARLPAHGGKGFDDLFDNASPLTMTPFVQNVNYQRALQTELARSLMRFEAVKSAQVILARPDPSPFIRDQRSASASVMLTLKPGAVVTRATAASMVSLVAKSVDGLKPENVAITDSTGRTLSDPRGADRDGLPTPQLEFRRELENYLAAKAEEMLAPALGGGRAVVRVSADVNFQKVKERVETYAPDGKAVAAERQSTTKSSAASARGPVGAVSNVSRGGGVPTSGGGGGGSSQEERLDTDYLVSKTVRELEDGTGGAVTRLTIAVVADLSAQGDAGGKGLTADAAQEIVKNAVGFRPGRDEIKLTDVRLPGPPAAAEPDEELARVARVQAYVGLARNVCLAAAVVLALALGPLLVLRRRRAAAPVPLSPAPAGSTTEDRRRELLGRLADLIRADPDRAAGVFGTLVGGAAG